MGTTVCHFFVGRAQVSAASINLPTPPRVGDEVVLDKLDSVRKLAPAQFVRRVVWIVDALNGAHCAQVFVGKSRGRR